MIYMYKIAVLGDKSSICGFAAVGMDTFEAENAEDAERLIDRLAKNKFGIIYITEGLAAKIPEAMDKYRFTSIPAIIQIPGISGNTGAGLEDVAKSVEKAVGSNIL